MVLKNKMKGIYIMLALDKLLLNTPYEKSDFSEEQIKEMELGLKQNSTIDYCNPLIPVEEMKKLRGPVKIKF